MYHLQKVISTIWIWSRILIHNTGSQYMFFCQFCQDKGKNRNQRCLSSYICKEKNGEMAGKSYWEIKGKICLLLFLKSRREMG
jgi:hypothetical protein